MKFQKKLIVWAIVLAVAYFMLSYHFIFIGSTVRMLKKSNLTLNYTFYSVKGKPVAAVLAVDELRYDGIGDLLVEEGILTEEQLETLLAKIEEGDG